MKFNPRNALIIILIIAAYAALVWISGTTNNTAVMIGGIVVGSLAATVFPWLEYKPKE